MMYQVEREFAESRMTTAVRLMQHYGGLNPTAKLDAAVSMTQYITVTHDHVHGHRGSQGQY